MTSTREYLALLGADPCGHIRKLLRDTTGNQQWADEFCDGLVHRLSLQDELERCSQHKVNTWLLDVPQWQVNVCAPKSNGWNVTHTGDLLADLVTALKKQGKMWGA